MEHTLKVPRVGECHSVSPNIVEHCRQILEDLVGEIRN